MDTRTISTKQRAWLLEALQAWRGHGIVSEEQAGRILDLYETPATIADRQRSRGIFTLMGVGALLVGLAVLLLIGYNWDAMPRGLKLTVIFGAIAAAHGGGFHLRYARHVGRLSEVAFFLGCLFYGAGIWLVAQIFHLSAHYPDGVWWWAMGVLPFALCLDTLLLHALFAALMALWAGMEVLQFGHLGAWFLGRWDLVPNGAYSLPLLAAPGVWWAYRQGAPAGLRLYVPLLAWWVVLQPFAWRAEGNPVYFIGGVGGLMLLVAEYHREGSPFAIPYRAYGMLLAGGVLMALSYHSFHLSFRSSGVLGVFEALPALVLGIAMLLLAVAPRHGRNPWRRLWLPAGLVTFMAALPWMGALFRALGSPRAGGVVVTVLANVAVVACALWLIRLGLREDRGVPFGAGVLYFLSWTVQRYTDLFGDFGGMLGASLMFFLCGATLFGVAMYWRRRKEVRHV
jgi:uncharacterized membrane protein